MPQKAGNQPATTQKRPFATRWEIAKGGIGMIDKTIYIVTKSATNELIVKPSDEKEKRWKGKTATKPELVFVYDGKVWSNGVPDGFDLSKSVVVSFEGSKARFFDFRVMSGGYYERILSE